MHAPDNLVYIMLFKINFPNLLYNCVAVYLIAHGYCCCWAQFSNVAVNVKSYNVLFLYACHHTKIPVLTENGQFSKMPWFFSVFSELVFSKISWGLEWLGAYLRWPWLEPNVAGSEPSRACEPTGCYWIQKFTARSYNKSTQKIMLFTQK